jgi:arginine/lysine/ornithine decarboxylase
MLLNQLEELAQSDHYPFHMPGHKRMLDFPNPYAVDITEIEGFDNLHHAQGVIRDAQARAARLYGSKRAYYLVNGSTCGILAAISAAVPRGSRILIARNSHKAVYHAVYLRQLSAEYVYPVDTVSGIQGQITVQQIEEHLAENPSIQAVVITSPTYDGLVSDVASIAAAVHQHNMGSIRSSRKMQPASARTRSL